MLILALVVHALLSSVFVVAQIPSISNFSATSEEPFILTQDVRIIVDSKFQNSGSPSLTEYAETFRKDIFDVTGLSMTDITIGTLPTNNTEMRVIFLSQTATPVDHKLYSGEPTGEGYELTIHPNQYVIRGASAIGAWWGTRTLLQQAILNDLAIPAGCGSDSPGWEVRGLMLDAGRHWFQTSFLADLCIYASFFKIQTFHIHASDNLWDQDIAEDWRDLYAAFRFQPAESSPIYDLVPLRNESWSKEDFQTLQNTCLQYGVTVVPEIDTPAHSLVISKWKEDLMIPGQPDVLNLSHPDTIPTIKLIWDEVVTWFASSEVHIGADEYDADLADEYIGFVNDMQLYLARKNKTIRIWGTNEPASPGSNLTIGTGVIIQHWDFPDSSIPVQLMEKGYSVINSEQEFLYLDGKTSEGDQFPYELNPELLWSGAPGGNGWAPNIFSRDDASNNSDIRNPLLKGSCMVLWNDWGNIATTSLEIYYQLAKSLAMFGEKAWAGSERDSALSWKDFSVTYPLLNKAAPGQNLNRALMSPPEQGNLVFYYPSILSGERITTPFDSVGPPYTMQFWVQPSNGEGTIFAGEDSILHVDSLAFTSTSTNITYPLQGGSFALPQDALTRVEIYATTRYTYALINDSSVKYWWTTNLDLWGQENVTVNMSFAAPSKYLGFNGKLRNVSLRIE